MAIEQKLERIKRLEERIEEESKNPELAATVARLGTLRGVDTITAMTVVSGVIDLNRFSSPRELIAFIGLAIPAPVAGHAQKHPDPPTRTASRGCGDRTKSGAAAPQKIRADDRQRKTQGCGGRVGGTGTGRFRVGDWKIP